MSRPLWLTGVVGSLALLGSYLISRADTPTARIGQKVAPFTLTDPRDQTRIRLANLKDRKAIVVLFLGTECPINNAFLPRLAELHKEYGPRGVQFLAINANRQDTAERVAAHARKYEIPFPVLKDADNRVADSFGARRTPEAFILDATATIRYQGRIDDQYGVGFQRPRPTRRDLVEALEELLAGKAVSVPTTPVAGCIIARAAKPQIDGPITYSKHVARILQKNCQQCHRPGQIGPMALLTFDDASNWSQTIREVVSDGIMPPWHADPRYGKFSNDRRLSPEDRANLLAWIDQGCPRGDDRDLPPPVKFNDSWQIGKPDMVLTMPEEFDVPAQMPKKGIPYKHFFIDTNFKEDRWVVRAEARPGSPEVVHHMLVFILPPGKPFFKDNPNNLVLCGTAPGDMPMVLRPGMAKRIPAGSRLVLQMHYTPNGQARKDRSSIGLIFTDKPPEREVLVVPIVNFLFRIPPGAENYKLESSFRFEHDGQIIDFMPHMHLRGKDFLYEVIYPEGKNETLLSIPRYNFNWQSIYRLERPLPVRKGTQVHCVAHFDNSAKNPLNPDPTRPVFWGDQTWQEMMIGWMGYAYDLPVK